jgi:3-methyladenine DNA glycosylase AlkD
MSLIEELETVFKKFSNETLAEKQKHYMRNLFSYYGLPKPIRASLQKPILKKYFTKDEKEVKKTLNELWEKKQREFQYAALDIADAFLKFSSKEMLASFEMMIRKKSWWDTVDMLSGLVGNLLLKHEDLISKMDSWILDENLWIRRSALIFQLKWKDRTDQTRLFKYCSLTMHESDFFIRKAIGWALRQYSKTNPLDVKKFLYDNQKKLSPLSTKEAGKFL